MSVVENTIPKIAGTMAFFADPVADGRGLSADTINFMVSRILNWHFPDLRQLWSDIRAHPQYSANIIGGGVAAFVIPLIQKYSTQLGIPIPATINRVLTVVKKIAGAAAIGGSAAALTWLPGLQAGGPVPGGVETYLGAGGVSNIWSYGQT